MSKAKAAFISAFIGTLTVIVLVAVMHPNAAKPAEQKAAPVENEQACVKEACIEITQEDGKKFKLNDFRFQPNHCIQFKEFGTEVLHYTCGNYNLQWIGPDNMDQKHGTPIETQKI